MYLTSAVLITDLKFVCRRGIVMSELRTLYPEIEPFETGRLKVSAVHELYYEQCGNPEGKPVVFLHGGPGAGLVSGL